MPVEEALEKVIGDDPGRDLRQLGLIDANGMFAWMRPATLSPSCADSPGSSPKGFSPRPRNCLPATILWARWHERALRASDDGKGT